MYNVEELYNIIKRSDFETEMEEYMVPVSEQ